jgi:hypothetical protein
VLFAQTFLGEVGAVVEKSVDSIVGALLDGVALTVQVGLVVASIVLPYTILVGSLILGKGKGRRIERATHPVYDSRRDLALHEYLAETLFTQAEHIFVHIQKVI